MLNGIQVSKRLRPKRSVTRALEEPSAFGSDAETKKRDSESRVMNGGCLALSLRDMFITFGLAAFVKSFKCVKILITMQNPDLRYSGVNGV